MSCNYSKLKIKYDPFFYRKLPANNEALNPDIEHEQAMKKEKHKRENVYMNSDVLQTELKHLRGMPGRCHKYSLLE